MRNRKFYEANYQAYLLSFAAVILLFVLATTYIVRNQIEDEYQRMETSTLSIAKNYSRRLVDASSATEVVTELLDTRVESIGEAILFQESLADNNLLKELAEIYQVDEISVYDHTGTIIYSNIEENLGWQIYEGHPVQQFLDSEEDKLVEDIRRDTINGKFFKFGYVRTSENYLVQVGILADNIDQFYRQFRFQSVLDEMIEERDLLHAFLLGEDGELLATSSSDVSELYRRRPGMAERLKKDTVEVFKVDYLSQEALHVSAPIYHEEEKIGNMVFLWSIGDLEARTGRIIQFASFSVFFIMLVNGILIYYAYKKDQSHVQLAYFDRLTGLPNQEHLDKALEEIISRKEQKSLAILLVNCAHFRTKNISFGFKYGDEVLIQIAKLLKSKAGDRHEVFRFNADRFVILIRQYENREELEDYADGIIRAFRLPFVMDTRQEFVDVEIAVLELNEALTNTDIIFQEVNLALNSLKESDQKIIFYADEMEEKIRRERLIEEHLRRITSCEDVDSFSLVYQPKYSLKEKEIDGFEALARIVHPTLGNISPAEFIDIAEKELLIYRLGTLILDEACIFLKELHKWGIYTQRVAVNISSKQLLRDDFISDVQKIVLRHSINPSLLEFEITESMFEENFDFFNEKLRKLKKMGIHISLDDFGTGYSSFARLRELEIDTIKIDKYFIDNVLNHQEEELITGDIISMAHKLKLQVVAEGVETEKQLAFLQKMSCDSIQGYYFSRPLIKEDALKLISQT